MTPLDLLSDLAGRGVKLWTEGNDVGYRGPPGSVTDQVKARLRRG